MSRDLTQNIAYGSMVSETVGAPPCFYYAVCGGRAAVAKCGKAVCASCAAKMSGEEHGLGYQRPQYQDSYPMDWFAGRHAPPRLF